MKRPHFIPVLLLATLVILCPFVPAIAEVAADFDDYPLTRITDKIYVIHGPFELPNKDNRGFRNNVVIVLTNAGVVVLDPGGSAWAGEMVVDRIRTLTRDPVVAVFNSHPHGDHWLGNESIKRAYPNSLIYGHPVMRDRVTGADGTFWLAQINSLTEGTAGGRRVVAPDRSVNDGDVVEIGDTRFRIHHIGHAHTDSDIMVEIVEQNTLFTGDVVRNGLLGIMESDASFSGNIAAIDAIIARDYMHYIPGHGHSGGIEVVNNYRTYLDTLLSKVRDLYAEQLSDYEMKPVLVETLADYRDWAGFEMRLGPHISRAYLEIEMETF